MIKPAHNRLGEIRLAAGREHQPCPLMGQDAGRGMALQEVELDLNFADAFKRRRWDAYERLLPGCGSRAMHIVHAPATR